MACSPRFPWAATASGYAASSSSAAAAACCGRWLIDPLHLRLRRYFIKEFLRPDAELAVAWTALSTAAAARLRRGAGSLFSVACRCFGRSSHSASQPAHVSGGVRTARVAAGGNLPRLSRGLAIRSNMNHRTCSRLFPRLSGFVVSVRRRPVCCSTGPSRGTYSAGGWSPFARRADSFAVMDGRCAHLGTDLGAGRVVDETLECPFHNWRYGSDGRCVRIPASVDIPDFARLRTYPAIQRHGFVFFFNGTQPLFPLPFFPGEDPADFVPSRPFDAILQCPWWMVGANVFDVQHFKAAHDRQLVERRGGGMPDPVRPPHHGRFRCIRRYAARSTGALAGRRLASACHSPTGAATSSSPRRPFAAPPATAC